MKVCTNTFSVSVALCAMGCFALVFQGCERKPEQPVPAPHEPASYMRDAKFIGKLTEARKVQIELERERNSIAAKMKEKIEAMRVRLKTDDLGKVKAELEKDAEWRELYCQCTNANAKCSAHKNEVLRTVRERITPKKPISK